MGDCRSDPNVVAPMLQALRQWEPHLNQNKISHQEQRRLIQLPYKSVYKSV